VEVYGQMSDTREGPPSAGSDPGESVDTKRIIADRFSEAGLATDRFINVLDGEKGTHDHDRRFNDPRGVPGQNYGVYAGSGLIDLDIDDYGKDTDTAGLEAVLALPETLTVASPHTDGDPGGHRYYHVTGDMATVLESTFGKANPQPTWGEVRAKNQYVVGPGSELESCDKEWHDCGESGEGHYTIANDAPIATITAEELIDALDADPDLTTSGDSSTDRQLSGGSSGDKSTGQEYDPVGTTVDKLAECENDVATYLGAGAKAAGFASDSGGGDRSRADYRVSCLAIEYGVPESEIRDRLAECRHSKVDASDAAHNYWRQTWAKALANVDAPNSKAPAELRAPSADGDHVERFREACDRYHINPARIETKSQDGENVAVGVKAVVGGLSIEDAVFAFKRKADSLSGEDKQAVIGAVIVSDLQDRGEFFKTPHGELYYFHDSETRIYRVDHDGRRVLTEDFQGFVWERYNLFAGSFSRNLGTDLKSQARRDAPERAVYRFAHYNQNDGELYITDFGDGYYAVTSDAVEWRPNGTDVFFLPNDRSETFEYLEPADRPGLPDEIPGERPLWCGHGDAIMRLFGNRINYDENAALAPADQRKQLYLHLHTLPFIDELIGRPIMAWVGEKGSGKTVLQRSIGRFIYGPEFRESVMPDSKEDFIAKVSNQTLAFIDNYDDGVEWANDVLASLATGSAVDLREYYTTNDLHQEVPRCWLSLTSRDPPFRRDDVADRTLVFRVARVEDGFVGEGDYLRQATAYRDLLWSVYLDNLQSTIREYHDRDTGAMSSDHRMAGWAIFARTIADALDVSGVDELLETMETERATFALENEPWARVLGRWIEDHPTDAATYRGAGDLTDALEATANDHDLPLDVTHAAGLGSKLSNYREELAELYDLEIDDSERSNQYRFATDTDGHDPTGLGRYG
jgi:hypothetical protein